MTDKLHVYEVMIGTSIIVHILTRGYAPLILYPSLVVGLILCIHGLKIWRKKDAIELQLQELELNNKTKENELKNKNIPLSFDIGKVFGEYDISYIEHGRNQLEERFVTNYDITLKIFNSSDKDVVIRTLKVKISNDYCDVKAFLPKRIKSNNFIILELTAILQKRQANRGEIIRIEIEDINGTTAVNTTKLNHYSESAAITDRYGPSDDEYN